jgi:hypothetical protein
MVGGMALRLARTSAEAHLYMELHPCETCGETAFSPASSIIEAEGDLANRYAGPCGRCGTPREFTFRLPQEILFPDDDEPSFGDERPSELIDAGEWLWVADLIARNTPAQPEPGMTGGERRQAFIDLRTAAAVVGEALKFAPPGAEAVPAGAVWIERGQTVYATEPGRFRKIRLEAVQQTYRRLAERFV